MSSRSSVKILTWGDAEPGRDVPVDRAEVVALLVGADLGELHPLPPEDAAELAGEERVDHAAGAKGDALDLLEEFGWDGAIGER